jgi:membrane fusion protein, macrolide-specific efflux system
LKHRLLSGRYFLLALIALAIIWVLAMRAVKTHRPTEVVTAPVAIGDIEDSVVATGTVQPFKLVSVGAQASGRIVALHVTLGDHVIKGQLIAETDPSTQRNALEIAEATLEQERAQRTSRAIALKQADLAFKRATTTYTQDASSRADYEAAEATYEGTKSDVAALDAQIRQATVQVDTARVTLGYTKVIAPMDGTVVAIVAPEGQTVNAVQAAPTIVKLANLDIMTVKVQISEADVTRVHPGQKVCFTILSAPDRRYEGKLRAVEPAPESIATDTSTSGAGGTSGMSSSSAVYYNGLFDVPNVDGALRTSMTAQVNIILAEAKKALTIPTAALISGPTGTQEATVQVVGRRGRVESRRVRVGINNHVIAQVLSGLAASDRVILGDAPK